MCRGVQVKIIKLLQYVYNIMLFDKKVKQVFDDDEQIARRHDKFGDNRFVWQYIDHDRQEFPVLRPYKPWMILKRNNRIAASLEDLRFSKNILRFMYISFGNNSGEESYAFEKKISRKNNERKPLVVYVNVLTMSKGNRSKTREIYIYCREFIL